MDTVFNGVATKNLNHYLTWFQVLKSIHHQRNEVTMHDMMVKGIYFQAPKPMIPLDYLLLLYNGYFFIQGSEQML
ncbi:hypothetical protein HFA01_08020 [Halobacillus faecis]|uniref:Uncharacterized protein n=1 Tax=Halobacillus faecis TaxID=360184 RepID=A0A511WN27_9BACI|nr:hypothetical protein HFA01_08020 [Halobacillus faecis]